MIKSFKPGNSKIQILESLLLFLMITLIFSQCKKNELVKEDASASLDNLTVPKDFDWKMHRTVPVSITVNDRKFGTELHVIQVYNSQGKLIAKGSANANQPFNVTLTLPADNKSLYIIKTAPDGTRSVENLSLGGEKSQRNMYTAQKASINFVASMQPGSVSPTCSGADETIYPDASPVQTVNIGSLKVVALAGDYSNKEVRLLYSGTASGTLRICGTNVKITQTNALIESQIIEVTSTGSAKLHSDSDITIKGNLVNYGSISIEGLATRITHDANLTNYGTLTSVGGSPLFRMIGTDSRNYGSMIMNKAEINTFTNYGQFESKHTTVGNQFENYCRADLGDVKETGPAKSFTNRENAYLKIKSIRKLAGQMSVFNNSFTYIQSLVSNQFSIQGDGLTNLLKIDHVSRFDTLGVSGYTANISGGISVCDPFGEVASLAALGPSSPANVGLYWGSSLTCSTIIPATNCNPGFAGGTSADTDQDGIGDLHDDFPNDPARAFRSPGAMGTLLFEDQWPMRGDYDMNDLVIGYGYEIITNASNQVVGLFADYTLKAAGGNFNNGFAVEFPFGRNNVAHILGGTLESQQPQAVAIIFPSTHSVFPTWNTNPSSVHADPKNFHLEISLAHPMSLSALGQGPYNPFIWNNSSMHGRGLEVHLHGEKPTALAKESLFQTYDDKTVLASGQTYLTEQRFPWVLNIPSNTFKYPKERADILAAYPKFASWVTSGGAQFEDWYSNDSEGYRIYENIYPH